MSINTVLVTGGAGYVGSVLVPRLLTAGFEVKVLDLYLYGSAVFDEIAHHPLLEQTEGDIRDQSLLKRVLKDCDAVIHLACISNDPSFELDPKLGREINFEAFEPLVKISREQGVQRFIYASSSSVYGVSDRSDVEEDDLLRPLTDYSRYKALCEEILLGYQSSDFIPVIIRPATICGYSPRQRFDLTVNILTNHAVNNGRITVFGGSQKRPNLHIDDMVDLYVQLLGESEGKVAGKAFNAGYQNSTVSDLAKIVRTVVKESVKNRQSIEILTTSSDDLRSYHISSRKIRRELGFIPKRTIEDAVRDLCRSFEDKKFIESMSNPYYFNIKRMQEVNLR